MNKALCLCILFICSTFVQSLDVNSFKNINRKKDVFREYKQFSFGGEAGLVPYQFFLVGASVGGTLSGTNTTGKIDTSLFRYQTMPYVFPSLTFSYAEGNINLDIKKLQLNFGISAIATGFMPTFIIEYTEENGIDGFQLDGDSVVGMVDLSKYTYKTTSQSADMTGSDGKTFKVYKVTSTSKNGLFQMNFTIPERSVGIDGNAISASQTKVDVGIYNYYDEKINKNELDFCDIKIPDWATSMPSIPDLTLPPITLPPITLPPITLPPVTIPPILTDLPFPFIESDTVEPEPIETKTVEPSNINIPVLCDGTTGPSKKQSKLALLSFVAAVKLKVNDKGEASVTFDVGKNFSVTYDWIGKAKVNTGNGAKNSKVFSNVTDSSKGSKFGLGGISKFLSDMQSLFITYSFDGVRPSSIEWDPTLGASNYEPGYTDDGPMPEENPNSAFKTTSSLFLIVLIVLSSLLILN
ncbi:hypothetical protein DDB_G0279957 [Dictyostelium discoideum AX4]|uniref:Uncharacterized protein n=1 Tax=Dictyostelium discoideum TaxID=44689 RepID=Q54W27_DICDI|nr:hypothetical protein DDB_G0279957 [Dictyostelium discoideum AX4]EAL67450.1 hypothetical protein DDB_G0279957 [Dictyostelium discoideum AX4]|eukprot:XP_641423.1 hypothetical protein DDB_G0279957 [Dictyostelium discoideum AX4]